jgi:uncharacterized protein YidB (DUF937 family)
MSSLQAISSAIYAIEPRREIRNGHGDDRSRGQPVCGGIVDADRVAQALGGKPFDIDDEEPLDELAKKFRVSRQALENRIRKLPEFITEAVNKITKGQLPIMQALAKKLSVRIPGPSEKLPLVKSQGSPL